eukprot:42703-Eustigmatos_ZCMA.PRE.1
MHAAALRAQVKVWLGFRCLTTELTTYVSQRLPAMHLGRSQPPRSSDWLMHGASSMCSLPFVYSTAII